MSCKCSETLGGDEEFDDGLHYANCPELLKMLDKEDPQDGDHCSDHDHAPEGDFSGPDVNDNDR